MAGNNFLAELRDLVQFNKSGELSNEEFAQAKAVLFKEAESTAVEGNFDKVANAENRPLEEGKRYRRRSAADWIARTQKDIKNAEAAAANDKRKAKMLAFVGTMNAEFAGGANNSSGISADTIKSTIGKYFTADGYIDYADFAKGGNILAGRFDVKSGAAAEVLDLWTNLGEYNFDFANATMAAFNNLLYIDMGWYKIIGKGSKKAYENSNKAIYYFNDDITKVTKMECYWEDDPNDIEGDSIIDLFKDEGFPAEIEKRKLKPDGPAFKPATV